MKHLKHFNRTSFVIALLIIIIVIFSIGYFKKIEARRDKPSIEAAIQIEIDKANYCDEDTDCILVSFGCPFGCWDYINKSEEDNLKKLIKEYHKNIWPDNCVYKCHIPSRADKNPICSNNKCITHKMSK
jgi:hypothetical protein